MPPSTDLLAAFVAAAEAGSATQAAAALGVGISTVTRRLAALEDDAGAALFARTPDGLSLTPAGRALLGAARAALDATERAATALASLRERAAGHVRVAVTDDVLEAVILPMLHGFHDAHPEVSVEFLSSTELTDLGRREADLAVRAGNPGEGDGLVAVRLRDALAGVFSRPEVGASSWVGWDRDHAHVGFARWVEAHAPPGTVRVRCNSLVMIRRAVAAGLGASMFPWVVGRVTPGLVELPFPDLPEGGSLWLVGHRAVRHTPPVDAMWRWLHAALAHDPDRDEVEELATLRTRLEAQYGWRYG